MYGLYIEMTPETSSTTLIFSSRDSKFSFLAIFDSFWPFLKFLGQKMKKSFSPHFEEFYCRHFKPSLRSLRLMVRTCSPNELAAPVPPAYPLALLETGARSKNDKLGD